MKPLSLILAALFFISCEGPAGPPGEDGLPGPVGQAFELEGVDFNESNNYSQLFDIPTDIEVLDTDIVAVYLLWAIEEGTGNDVWQPLPVSYFFEDGELQYGFDHTWESVQLFLTGDTDLSTVDDEYTQNQVFRVAILPVDYVQTNKVDMTNMQEVMKAVDKSKVERLRPVQ